MRAGSLSSAVHRMLGKECQPLGWGQGEQIPNPDMATSPLRGEGALSCPRATNRCHWVMLPVDGHSSDKQSHLAVPALKMAIPVF